MTPRTVRSYSHPALVIDRTGDFTRARRVHARRLLAAWAIGAVMGAGLVAALLLPGVM